MGNSEVRYETKTVTVIRGFEARTRTKWETDGWEFVETAEAPMLRTRITFRRVKKPIPRWAWVAGGAVAVALVGGIVLGSVLEGDDSPAPVATTEAAAVETTPAAAPTPTVTPTAESTTALPTDAEVLAVFDGYFAERSAAGVVLAKSISDVTFQDKVLRVTFDPAHAGIDQDQFDYINPFPNLAKFAASPIAFNDDVGNRTRPAVDRIDTVRPDGTTLGSFSRPDILALNELDQ